MRALAPPWPALDDAADRLTLRDGTVAAVRPAVPTDRDAVAGFFAALSPESRRGRLFASGAAPARIIDALVSSASDADALTFVVERTHGPKRDIVAVASYARTSSDTAEVSFAVADDF